MTQAERFARLLKEFERVGVDPNTISAGLAVREEEVLRLISQGHPIKQIASRLEVGVRTVETYKARAMEKLGLKSRTDVVRYAAQRGWLSEP